MNAKGYNNRCILGWLADCLAIVVKSDIPADRFVGAWIQSQVNANNMTWPMHEMLEPSAICLTFGLCNMTKLCQILSMVYRYRQKLWSQLLHFTLMPFHHLPPFPSSGMHSTGCFWQWSHLGDTCDSVWPMDIGSQIQCACFENRIFLLANPRTEQQADLIYSHGMMFLRTHRFLTFLSQRRGPTGFENQVKIGGSFTALQAQPDVLDISAENPCNLASQK